MSSEKGIVKRKTPTYIIIETSCEEHDEKKWFKAYIKNLRWDDRNWEVEDYKYYDPTAKEWEEWFE